MKNAVLTYHFGNHDFMVEPKCKNLDWEFYCLTNNKKLIEENKSSRWNFVYISDTKTKSLIGNKRKSSFIKIYPYNYIKNINNYKYLLNLDGNCIIRENTNLNVLCKDIFDLGTNFSLQKLLSPDCGEASVGAEGQNIINHKRDTQENVNSTIKKICKHPSLKNEKHIMGISNVILRKNDTETRKFFQIWKDFYIRYESVRDQLTFPLAVSHYNKHNDSNIKIHFFKQSQYNCFDFYQHKKKYN